LIHFYKRLLIKLASDKELKEKFDKTGINYDDVKERNKETYKSFSDVNIIKFIKETLKTGYEVKDIEKAIAISEKYSIALGNGARCIYSDLPNITHSCSPNTYYMVQTTREVVFRASTAIRKGEVVTYSKADLTKCNLFRRRLLDKQCVVCECKRCCDGTEFGTGYGSLQCDGCDGILSSSNSRDEGAEWTCGGCAKKRSGKECVGVLDELNNKLAKLSKSADDSRDTISDFEKILSREGEWKQLPQNSQLFLDVRYRLIFIYGYHAEFYHVGMDNAKGKSDHCDEWLKLTQQIFPGRNYYKIWIDFEKINASVSLMNFMKQSGQPTEEVNQFIADINRMGFDPLDFAKEEVDQSLCKAIKSTLMIATEAREEQKKRILINRWADEDDEW